MSSITSGPMFPASRDELSAFAPVLEVTCCESKASYDKVKTQRVNPEVSYEVGEPYRKCTVESYTAVLTGECKGLFKDLLECQKRNIHDSARKCKDIRQALRVCAVQNKVGEIGKSYSA